MLFTSEEHKTTFELPDRPTGRVILAYEEEIERPGGMYERAWNGLCKVAQNWKSPVDLSPATLTDEVQPEAIAAVKWAALAGFSWYLDWKNGVAPKN